MIVITDGAAATSGTIWIIPMTNRILLVLDGLFHPPLPARLALERYLRALDGYEFTRVRSLEALTRLDLTGYKAMVLYYHHRQVSEEALGIFERFVLNGGGVVALHSASASFKQPPETAARYADVLGGRFLTHGKVEPVFVRPTREHTLFEDIPDFYLIDELYRHTYNPANTIHFWVDVAGEHEPVAWSRAHGLGRVFYLSSGHRTAVFDDPNLREIIRRGLAWVCAEVGL